MRALWTGLVGLGLLLATGVRADDDPNRIDATGSGWNDLGDLIALCADLGFPANTPERLELWRLPPEDAVIIVHPTSPVPYSAVSRFVRAGGRLALLDDFGQGHSILRELRIGRHPAGRPPQERRLRGNPHVSIATPSGRDSLTAGVEALVMNHTQVLYHSELQPVFSLGDGASAVVLKGQLDKGHVVVVSDASIVINNMLRFRGNRRFARNLITFLMADRGGQLWIVTDDTPVIGRRGRGAPEHPLTTLRDGLRKLSDLELPPLAVWQLSWALAFTMLVFAMISLPRRRGPGRPQMEDAPMLAGYEGRIEFFSRPRRNLFGAVMAYKFEFESELVRLLDLPGRPSRIEIASALGQVTDPPTAAGGHALLTELDALSMQKDRAPSPPEINAQDFGTMVEDGRRVLAAIDSRNSETSTQNRKHTG